MQKQRILLVDTITFDTENLTNILNEFFEYKVDMTVEYEKAISMYSNNSYEFIILDHNVPNSDAIIEHVLTKNPLQKFILLSESLQCPIPCNICLSNFSFVRLLKPIDLIETFKYIKNKVEFVCPNKHVFSNINTLQQLNEFINLEKNCSYKQKELTENQLYIKPDFTKNVDMYEVERIKNLVNEEYFIFSILDDGIIEIALKQ
jgi:hypothetical protein